MVTSFDGDNELQDNENKKTVELYKKRGIGNFSLGLVQEQHIDKKNPKCGLRHLSYSLWYMIYYIISLGVGGEASKDD